MEVNLVTMKVNSIFKICIDYKSKHAFYNINKFTEFLPAENIGKLYIMDQLYNLLFNFQYKTLIEQLNICFKFNRTKVTLKHLKRQT